MLKVGILLDLMSPSAGGASSILQTIQEELEHSAYPYEINILYQGKPWKPYRIEHNGLVYINVKAGKIKCLAAFLLKRISLFLKNVVRFILLHNTQDAEQFLLDEIANKEKIDLLWFTYPAFMQCSVPYIYTIWDFGHRMLPMFPEMNSNWNNRERKDRIMLEHASFIITGNESGKQEILQNCSINPDKIRIVPFPVSFFCKGNEKKPDVELPSCYFFYPAQFWAHKNHIVILKALEVLKNKYGIACCVVFTGSDKGNYEYIKDMCRRLELADQVFFLDFVTFEELKYLYVHATGLVFASLLGPNNLPLIEAAYLGCPVIATDIAGHKEQLQDCALYFNATDENQLARCMLDLLENQELRTQMKNKMSQECYDVEYTSAVYSLFDEFALFARTWKNV